MSHGEVGWDVRVCAALDMEMDSIYTIYVRYVRIDDDGDDVSGVTC